MLGELFQIHLRLGFTRILFVADLIFAIYISWDVATYMNLGLSLHSAALATGLPQPYPIFLPLCTFLIFLTILLPAILAFAKVAAIPGFASINPASRPRTIAFFHCALCLFFVAFATLAVRMEMFSGLEQAGDTFTTLFRSRFLGIVASPIFSKVIAALGSLGGVAATTLAGVLIFGDKSGKTFRQYVTRARLADLPTELHPERSPFEVALTGIEANRAIPLIKTLKQEIVDKYHNEMDSRSKRLSYVHELLHECDELIKTNLIEGSPPTRPNGSEELVEIGYSDIFVDQDAAWEAALRAAPPANVVVVGPSCTHRITSEIEAYCAATGLPIIKLPTTPADEYLNWPTRQRSIVAALKAAVDGHKSATLVISHVSYASGVKVPLHEFIRNLRSEVPATSVYVVVDGTNAVGNGCRIPSKAGWDAYLFSPDRWLLAPEPICVLLTKNSVSQGVARAGSLMESRRSYDAVLGPIAGFRASLEVINRRQLEYFWCRCSALRGAFVAGLPKSVRILSSQSGDESTFILSCYPAGNNSWRKSVREMNDVIGKICDSASMLTIDEDRPWMRVTFPYYLDPRDLNRLNAFLEDNTTD